MSSIEQFVIYIHWVDKEMTVCEEYIGLMPVAHGQCYDECSTMTGTKNGVASQIMKLNEKYLLMQCYCHST